MQFIIHNKLIGKLPFHKPRIIAAFLLVTLSLIKPLISVAQDQQYRLYYQNKYTLNERWRILSLSGIYFGSSESNWVRLELRSGGYYQYNRDIEFFGSLRTHFTFDKEGNQFELRPFQGAHIIWPRINYLRFRNRFIIEERFLWSAETCDFNFLGRFRYRRETSIPINNPSVVNNTYYLRPMIEMFINLNTTDEAIQISSWKLSSVFGYRFTQKYAAEFRYEFQTTQNEVDTSERDHTHIFRLRFIHTLFRNRED
jgi:hypothetical protein